MQTRFILINPSHSGNVGAVARAMLVMGFTDLVLVNPRWDDVLHQTEAIERASGAANVLQQARICSSLEEAAQGISLLCATAMTARDFGPNTYQPRPYLHSLAQQCNQPTNQHQGVAFVFGSERFGMLNQDVYRCHACLQIPTNPTYGSLNLAAAVQLIAYEWRQALTSVTSSDIPCSHAIVGNKKPIADVTQITAMLEHLKQALISIDFLDMTQPRKLMPRLQQMFNRAQLSQDEINIWRGIAKKIINQNKK